MTKKNPFDYVKSVNHKDYQFDLSGYSPYLTNQCFSMHLDTILLAEEMNQASRLDPGLQYDFYYHSVRKGKRFGFPPKQQNQEDVEFLMTALNYSRVKAQEALKLLPPEELQWLKDRRNTGGTK